MPLKILDRFNDHNGNVLSILVEYENKRILIEGIYGPNGDSQSFYENYTFSKIESWNPHHSIFAGDFNLVSSMKVMLQGHWVPGAGAKKKKSILFNYPSKAWIPSTCVLC